MDLIDTYLDDLAARLRVGPARSRRFLVEAEEHLRDTVAREVAAGAAEPDAERVAIERFGTVRQVARAANGPVLARLTPLALGGAQLAAVGSATVLAGTLLSRLVAAVTSTTATFGFPHDTVASASQVAHWLAVQPGAADWPAAAASENAADTLVLRGGFALLCLLASLGVLWLLRRRTSAPADGVVPAIGMTAFGGAAAFLLLAGFTDSRTPFEWGRGLLLSDASVALVVAAAYAVVLLRRVQTPDVAPAPR
ncbi:HAAS signaling domain-containing protein [Nocardioides pocheonensis]|uniref:Uncharacterized protein n=1 Tax=Nocardioides pocheonensis TaxID=661485 RepID=A0A3N0GXQ6_9ACTN|nr:hypothetical protein [Nocardioides pocheonensis]RNM16928.1 hypothetical protein EFL26_02215 [Nocardioides pocheonensis]